MSPQIADAAQALAPIATAEELVVLAPGGVPAVERSGQAGCSCSSCGAGNGHAPVVSDQAGAWLPQDCPPAVISEGWCRRPFYFDGFIGAITGDDFVEGAIAQHTSFLAGGRLGWDLDERWGVEGRLAFSEVGISNTSGERFDRQADLLLADVSLVRYWFTDWKLRPFATVGLGVADWEFSDDAGNSTDEKVFGVPVGIGVKQRYDDWLVFRLDLTDNMAFGGGTVLGTQHNFSITGGFELRFGGARTSYWPWQPRKHYAW
jgi:hypothetical protein